MAGHTGNAFGPHPGHKLRAVAFPVKDQGEARRQSVFIAKQNRLPGEFPFQTWNNLLFKNLQQPGVSGWFTSKNCWLQI